MKDAAYSFHFHEAAQKYDGLFVGADKVTIEFKESTLYEMEHGKEPSFVVENNEVLIRFSKGRYYDYNRIETGFPKPESVFQDFHTQMKIAVEKFNNGDY